MPFTQLPFSMLDPASGQFGLRNKLINARGDINQRAYVSGAATGAANQYTVDRWRVVTSGQSLSWTTSGNVRTFTAPAGGVEQVIEGLNIDAGTYVLTWTGTATATVNGTSVANGASIALTGGANATVKFSSGTFSLPQLEIAVATPFETRPYGLEFALCQRYLPCIQAQSAADRFASMGIGTSATGASVILPFMVQPRVPPTGVTVSSAAHFEITDATTATALSGVTLNAASQTGARLNVTVAAGLTQYRPYTLQSVSASANLQFTGCEL